MQRRGRGLRGLALAWLAVALLLAGVAAAQPDAQTPPAAEAVSQQQMLVQLRALNAAALPDSIGASTLFGVRLDDLGAVEARIGQLEAELASLKEAEGVEPDPAHQLRRDLARERATYLETLSERLGEMPEAAQRILPELGAPRAALRGFAERTAALAEALAASASRLDALRLRLEAGGLVGFAAEARETARDFANLVGALRIRSTQLEAVAGAQLELAQKLEAEGRELRRRFFNSLRAPDREKDLNAAFHAHLEEKRRLDRATSAAGPTAKPGELVELIALAGSIPPERRLGTVAEASVLRPSLGSLLARSDAVTAAAPAALDEWRLAFENEAVTVLSGQVSAAVRREAYALSSSLLRDARAEAELAWGRAAAGWRSAREDVPTLGALFRSTRGRSWLVRALGVGLVFGAWYAAWRATGGLVVRGVRSLARATAGRFGLRVGTLVRGSGLVQRVLPVLLGWPTLWASQAFLGGDTVLAALLGAIASPLLWYALGLQTLLGATRRIEPWRPALIEVSASVLPRLQHTYARLGLVVAVGAVAHGVARIAIGQGLLVTWLGALLLVWVGVWAAWEAVAWRETLALAWQKRLPEPEEGAEPGLERRVAVWMERSRWGAVLSLPAALRLVIGWLESGIAEISRRTDIAELLEARRLRRAARSDDTPAPEPEALPEEYLREFPLRPILGDGDALLLPRRETVDEVLAQLGRWRESGGGEGSIAVVGEKGSGKTTLAALVASRIEEVAVTQHTLRGKPVGREGLYRALAPSLSVNGAEDFEDWIDGLCAGPERVVLLDECHNTFLRTVGGFEAYEALVELVNATSKQVFWVLLFNSFTWRFLNDSRSRQHYFRRLLEVPAWSADEIRELIRRRNNQTGFEVEFDEALLSGERAGSGQLELIEGADGYFRLLRETSGGNPRIATRLWLSSLSVVGEKKLRVQTFREPVSQALSGLSDELLFALAAISQHENLSTDELRRVLNVPEGLARFAVQYLGEAGLVTPKDGSKDRVTLSAPYYRQTLRALRNKHLLFE